MTLRHQRNILLLVLLRAAQDPTARVGADLRPGMQLVYSSNGQDQPPWVVDSVETRLALDRFTDCARVQLRRSPTQPSVEPTRLCVARDTLYVWDARQSAWQSQRPVGPGMMLGLPRPSGDTVRYTTGALSHDSISGRRVAVLTTTVLTVDSMGRPKRRLRERYALTLTTATGGAFEVPDPTAPGGWRVEQTFELREIRMPR